MKNLVVIALLVTSTAVLAEPLGYPGNTWNTIVYTNKAGTEEPNFQVQGVIEQGVDWVRFSDNKWKLNTFGTLGYSLDNRGHNTYTPALGVKVNRRYSNGSLDLGIRVVGNHNFVNSVSTFTGGPVSTTHTGTATQLFATFWFDWDLKGQE